MRWPIRNQILLPLWLTQLAVVVIVSTGMAWWSLAHVGRQVDERIEELAETIQQAQYPLTVAVLDQLRGLSGAEFVIRDSGGNVLTSTLAPVELQGSQPESQKNPSANPDNAGAAIMRFGGQEFLSRPVSARFAGQHAEVLILYPDSLIQTARRDAVVVPAAFGILTMLCSMLAVAVVAQRIGRRMQGIEQQVARVSHGDFRPIPEPVRNDELRDLSRSVNRMALELDLLTGRIRESERAQLIKQLAGGIAHQLRNAVTGARLAVQVHRRRCAQASDESLEVALRQLALTEEQIRGLVALVREESRACHPGNIEDVVHEVVRLIQPICDHRHLELRIEGSTGSLHCRDADQLRATVLNLCMNAVDASHPEGHLRIHLSHCGEDAVIDVEDDGPGVDAAIEADMFEPFRTTKSDGMGLGLSLVRQAAKDHDGSIAYSRTDGITRFRLTLKGIVVAEEVRHSEAMVGTGERT